LLQNVPGCISLRSLVESPIAKHKQHDMFINKEIKQPDCFRKFIASIDFDELNRKNVMYKNTRHSLYLLKLPFYPKEVIIKKSTVNPDYPLHRTISFYLRNLFKHYGKRAYKGAQLLEQAKIRTLKPLAYWKQRKKPFCFESCLMYERLEAEASLKNYTKQNSSDPDRDKMQQKMLSMCRKIHARNILHGDLCQNNFLVKGSKLAVIDTDHITRNYLPGRFLKRCAALRCFRRIELDNKGRRQFLKSYLEQDYSEFWFHVLQFWSCRDRRPFSRWLKRHLV